MTTARDALAAQMKAVLSGAANGHQEQLIRELFQLTAIPSCALFPLGCAALYVSVLPVLKGAQEVDDVLS
ncbi:MAG TPA: hypothetical protein VKN18_09735 [Blastocatellia bacterium]|nr:hypothetical protein [Blastocatellia bacterium]